MRDRAPTPPPSPCECRARRQPRASQEASSPNPDRTGTLTSSLPSCETGMSPWRESLRSHTRGFTTTSREGSWVASSSSGANVTKHHKQQFNLCASGGGTRKSRCQQGWFLQKVLGEDHSSPLPASGGFCVPWLAAPSLQSLCPSPRGLPLSVSPLLSFIRTPVIGFRAHLDNPKILHFIQSLYSVTLADITGQRCAFQIAI